ncbi:MAG: hypothetical protein SFT92_09035 [Rickettsiales bacterium]|nr:hypothetical protein [Rickettsiales bacterium]
MRTSSVVAFSAALATLALPFALSAEVGRVGAPNYERPIPPGKQRNEKTLGNAPLEQAPDDLSQSSSAPASPQPEDDAWTRQKDGGPLVFEYNKPQQAAPTKSYVEEAEPAKPAGPTKPLVVVRFNQKRVYFQPSLDLGVKLAQEKDPKAHFHVVSSIPKGLSKRQKENAKQNLQEVLGHLNSKRVTNVSFETKEYDGDTQQVTVDVSRKP